MAFRGSFSAPEFDDRREENGGPPGVRAAGYSSHSGAVELALSADLLRAVRFGGGIVALPPGLLPGCASVAQIDGGLVQDCFVSRAVRIRHTSRNQRAAAPHTFGVEWCFLVGYASLRQRPDDSARRAAGNGSERGGREPSGRHYRTEAGDSQQTKAREQAGRATKTCTEARSRSRAFRPIVNPIAIAIDLLVGAVPVVRIVRDDAQIRMRHARGLQARHRALRIGIVVVET